MSNYKIGSLFSGAGGLDMAALELFPDAEIAWHAENDAAASRVLTHHWPDTPNLGSVVDADWHSVERVDVLCGGPPCQDVSAAGQRAGLTDDTRSGLWSHMAAAIDVLRPQFVLIENVRGLLNARAAVRGVEPGSDDLGDDGPRPVLRALGAILGDLAYRGFDAQWACVRASHIGACHRRERVFILAYPAHSNITRLQGEGESGGPGAMQTAGKRPVAGRDSAPVFLMPTPRASDGAKGGPNQRGSSGDLMLSSAAVRWKQYANAIRQQEALSRPAPSPVQAASRGGLRLAPEFAEWMMFWPPGWVTSPDIGLSRLDQLRIIGNGVCPPQAVAAYRYLMSVAS